MLARFSRACEGSRGPRGAASLTWGGAAVFGRLSVPPAARGARPHVLAVSDRPGAHVAHVLVGVNGLSLWFWGAFP